jgi:hypothetical protein
VVTLQNAGSASIVQIIEKVDNSTSKPLKVPIQVPCLPASEPTSIVPALNSVTFNFAVAKTRKIVIGSTVYEANTTSVTIDGLTEGTYTKEIVVKGANPLAIYKAKRTEATIVISKK